MAVVGLTAYRLRNKRVSRASGRQFLVMGIIWVLVGLGYILWRGGNSFDIGLFNLGIIFTVAGGVQMVMERYAKMGK